MEEVINILHVVGTLNRGGAETLLLNLYKATNRSRIHFDFVVHSDFVGEYEKEFTAREVKFTEFLRLKELIYSIIANNGTIFSVGEKNMTLYMGT